MTHRIALGGVSPKPTRNCAGVDLVR